MFLDQCLPLFLGEFEVVVVLRIAGAGRDLLRVRIAGLSWGLRSRYYCSIAGLNDRNGGDHSRDHHY